jgi:predicted AAA+ superfamily ATPase
MLNFVKKLIAQGKITMEQVVFLDFSFQAGQRIDPIQLMSSYFELNPNQAPLFILDEVQDIANMRELILYLYNQHYKIFISGSNSKLLSSELSTHFRGRVFEYKVYPLTHREILDFAGLPLQNHSATEDKARIKNLYHTIFTYGSFPEILLAKDEFSQKELVK